MCVRAHRPPVGSRYTAMKRVALENVARTRAGPSKESPGGVAHPVMSLRSVSVLRGEGFHCLSLGLLRRVLEGSEGGGPELEAAQAQGLMPFVFFFG